MNPKRTVLAFVVALLLSGTMTWAVSRRVSKPEQVFHRETIKIYVAQHDLSAGKSLLSADLTSVDLALGRSLPGEERSSQQLIGRTLAIPLLSGEPILEQHLAAAGWKPGLLSEIPNGLRATSLHLNDASIGAGFIEPGSFVDVLASYRPEGDTRARSIIVLQNAQVLAVGQRIEPERELKPSAADSITLLVTPQQAIKLSMAEMQGKLSFALRNASDPVINHSLEDIDGAGIDSHRGPRPGQTITPQGELAHNDNTFTVETIAGSKHTNQVFDAVKP